tara:strand:- start:478 stop:1098 length:621 start_codon:yes stop_codon:yes gene_type:complete
VRKKKIKFKMQAVPHEAGVDEAGCGSLIGDLVAAAVVLPCDYDTTGLNDSKKLSEKKRNAMGQKLRNEVSFGVGKVSREEIDANGLAWARRVVFTRALDALVQINTPASIVVDGTGFFDGFGDIAAWKLEAKADSQYASVAAASIIAKTERDLDIQKLCDAYPEFAGKYGWRNNKGYPALVHKNGIRDHGITSFHRRSFAPCKACS